jgi:hypothetical protein
MRPSVGRIVHYHHQDGWPPFAAIITAVRPCETWGCDDAHVQLAVFAVADDHGRIEPSEALPPAVPYAETPTPGHWSWPPREG